MRPSLILVSTLAAISLMTNGLTANATASASAIAASGRDEGFGFDDLVHGALPSVAYFLRSQGVLVTAEGVRIHPNKGRISRVAQARPDVVFFESYSRGETYRWTPEGIEEVSLDWDDFRFQENSGPSRRIAEPSPKNHGVLITTAKSGMKVAELPGSGARTVLAFDGPQVWFVDEGDRLRRWNYETGKVTTLLETTYGRPIHLNVTADVLVTSFSDYTWVEPLTPGGAQKSYSLPDRTYLALSPDGRLIATREGNSGGSNPYAPIEIRDTRTGRLRASFDPDNLAENWPRWEDNRHFVPALYSKGRAAYVRMGVDDSIERVGPVFPRHYDGLVLDLRQGVA